MKGKLDKLMLRIESWFLKLNIPVLDEVLNYLYQWQDNKLRNYEWSW